MYVNIIIAAIQTRINTLAKDYNIQEEVHSVINHIVALANKKCAKDESYQKRCCEILKKSDDEFVDWIYQRYTVFYWIFLNPIKPATYVVKRRYETEWTDVTQND